MTPREKDHVLLFLAKTLHKDNTTQHKAKDKRHQDDTYLSYSPNQKQDYHQEYCDNHWHGY